MLKNSIILGDCLEQMKNLPDESVDCIISDLPYNIHRGLAWDSALDYEKMWEQFKRIIKPHTPIVLFAQGLFKYTLVMSNPKWYKYDMVWVKSRSGSPLTAKYKPLNLHENILVFGNGTIKYNPQMTEGGKPYTRKTTSIKVNNMKYGIKTVSSENLEGTRHPTTVLNFPQNWQRQQQKHSTQKPSLLMEYLVKTFSNDGDVVLDITAGSGSLADNDLNRVYILMEQELAYCKIMASRLRGKKFVKVNFK